MTLKPFFKFYGGKWRAALQYPTPLPDCPIIEPFAGSAGYSLHYPHMPVRLSDADPIIVGVWQYLIGVSATEILSLPDLEMGEDVRSLGLAEEAAWLIGFWLNSGSAQPKRTLSAGSLIPRARSSYWGPRARHRIAGQLDQIRHWTAVQCSYDQVDDRRATWFLDPPYEVAGSHYRYHDVDHQALGEWARGRTGLTIVCEAGGATWLPFETVPGIQAFQGRSAEAVWIASR